MRVLRPRQSIHHLILLSLGTLLFGGCSQSLPLEKVPENDRPGQPTSAESPAVAKELSPETASESTSATKITVVNNNSEPDNDSVYEDQATALSGTLGEGESSTTTTVPIVNSDSESNNGVVPNAQAPVLNGTSHEEEPNATTKVNAESSDSERDNGSVPNAQESALSDILGEEESNNTAGVPVVNRDLEPVNAITPKDASACCIAELSFY
jgi:hypothetical protein